MCPLRIILIFLSASLAGFFVLRNLNSQPIVDPNGDDSRVDSPKDSNSLPLSSQVPVFPRLVGEQVIEGLIIPTSMLAKYNSTISR